MPTMTLKASLRNARGLRRGATAIALFAAASAASAATPPNTLVMAWNIDAISTFDPAQSGEVVTNELIQNTCDALVNFAPEDERKIQPGFAHDWDVSEDGREITFHLRTGATFPSGNPVMAHDVAWSLQRVVHLGFGAAATLTEYGFTSDNVEEMIEAVDDETLVMRLDKPYPVNLIMHAIAANQASSVLDSQLIMEHEEDGDYGNRYLTTRTACVGPYRLSRWDAGEALILEANDEYWGDRPTLSRIFVRHVSEPGTQRLLLEQGDVDVARDLGPDDLADLSGSSTVTIEQTLRPQLFFWIFNLEDERFAHPEVRLAMRYLIDYEGLGDSVMNALGVPRASFVQLGAIGALDEDEGQPFSLDLERARELLAEAGFTEGFQANVIYGTLPHSAPIAQSVQQNASQVGIRLDLERMANAQLFARVRGREYQSAMLAWQTSVPDAHGNASRLVYNPDNSAEAQLTQYPAWRAAFYDEELNARVEEALLEADPDHRDQLYAELQRDVMETGPMAIMFQMYNVAGVRNEIQDWSWNGFRTYYTLASK